MLPASSAQRLQGVQGYAKQFGAAYSDAFISNFLSNALLAVVLHEDPSRSYPPESDMVEQILKTPYNLDVLTVTEAAKEREIKRRLLTHLRDLLLELGRGFSFVWSQVPLTVDG